MADLPSHQRSEWRKGARDAFLARYQSDLTHLQVHALDVVYRSASQVADALVTYAGNDACSTCDALLDSFLSRYPTND